MLQEWWNCHFRCYWTNRMALYRSWAVMWLHFWTDLSSLWEELYIYSWNVRDLVSFLDWQYPNPCTHSHVVVSSTWFWTVSSCCFVASLNSSSSILSAAYLSVALGWFGRARSEFWLFALRIFMGFGMSARGRERNVQDWHFKMLLISENENFMCNCVVHLPTAL